MAAAAASAKCGKARAAGRAAIAHARQVAELGECHQSAGAGHESNYDGFRDVARQVAEFEDRDQNLDAANHDSQQEHGLVGFDVRARC